MSFCSMTSRNGLKSTKTKNHGLNKSPHDLLKPTAVTAHPIHAHSEFENREIVEYIASQTRTR